MALEEQLLQELRSSNAWGYLDTALSDGRAVEDGQQIFTESRYRVLYRSPSASLIALRGRVSEDFAIDTILSRYHKAYAINHPPAPLVPVPSKDVARVRSILKGLQYNKTVARLVDSLSIVQMHKDITWLTGEAPESNIESRHSFHPDARKAAHWIVEQIESTGADCRLRNFLPGFTPNIICRYDGSENTDALVLLSAHYDSRGSFGNTRAPGGDDDGSGTTSILAMARAIGQSGITFKSNVELCLFAGEEQGLLGSRAYARELREVNADITLMIQADMLAYHKPGEPPQLGLPDLIGTPEVAQLVSNISALYSPELEVGFTPACCSDHQSFHEQGFAATQVFERAGPIADPMYHNSGDLSQREGYDFRQLKSIVKFATLLHAAGFDEPNYITSD
ncbi:Zn-dependent exopeptidase [Fomitiporia mediterranea MF3/22]|uniref:Zn-dependent exopeptidase n=1 Tax=Fomitiporia mediterranea (strain MF3/22) TaxID=694068 RepID=UPI000440833C|nr:Zn-dependent exopeptidase [Fomitiporia mediterranea MF3/22]EJD04790.1 Zn-dependent exopeptidase [Fomitiporia mediterranea MF3/22]